MEKALDPAAKGKDWRDSKTWYMHETLVLRVARVIVRSIVHRYARVEAEGFENLPGGPCVLACNHLSNADVLYMATALPRHPYYMAKIELFQNPVMAWFYRKCGAFPVYRGENDGWVIEQAGKILAQGKMLAIFPEGRRSKTRQLLPAKVGAVRLAARYKVPVVPMAIWGTEWLFKKGGPSSRARTVHLAVGPPIDLIEVVSPPYNYKSYQGLITVVMKAIAA
ncbi:MAG: lysophospholipid acyltransferase family protein, partial [Anaerolineae bacterium]